MLAAGESNFFVALDAGRLLAYSLADAKPMWSAEVKTVLAPVTGDDLVFVTSEDEVCALDQATGAAKWTIASGALAVAPVWRAGWLFTAAKDGTLSAWRATDGVRIWQLAVGAPTSASLAIDGDRLIVPLADNRLIAVTIPGGMTLWSVDLGGVGGEPLAAAGRIYVGASDYTFFSIKEDDGAIEWRHRLIRSTVVGRPVLDDRHIWVATLDNRVEALRRGNGEIEWMQTLPARPSEQLTIEGGEVIVPMSSGELAFFNQRDGKPVKPAGAPAAPTGARGRGAGTPPAATPPPAGSPAAGPPAGAPPTPPSAPAAPPATIAGMIGALLQALVPGTRLVPPLVVAGPDGAAQLLRVTLGSDDLVTVASFEREGKTDATPPGGSRGSEPAPRPAPAKTAGTAFRMRTARQAPWSETAVHE